MDSNLRRIWLSVIIQAIEDYSSKGNTRVKLQAKAWFTHNSADFKEVCYLAGLNPQQVKEKVLGSNISELREVIDAFKRDSEPSTERDNPKV